MNTLNNPLFNDDELIRYSKTMRLPQMGQQGQQRLQQARVLCVGAGGLGSPVLLYLAASGVGTLGIIDDDQVELSNLHRQVLFSSEDIGHSKALRAKAKLAQLNPNIQVNAYNEKLSPANALTLIEQYDIVVDGSDNFATRYLVNDACMTLKKANVFASIIHFKGQCAVFTHGGPCYRCLFPTPPNPNAVPNCAEGGVIGPLPGLLGTVQALEVIKLITQIGEPLVGRLLTIDALTMQFQQHRFAANPECPLCAPKKVKEKSFASLQQDNATAYPDKMIDDIPSINYEELQQLQANHNNFLLIDVREPDEHELHNIGGQLIPLGELESQLDRLDKQKKIAVYCRSGRRSLQAASLLKTAGFEVCHLQGGILAVQQHKTNK